MKRFYVSPCNDETRRTWDVCERRVRFGNRSGKAGAAVSNHDTRKAAQAECKRRNAPEPTHLVPCTGAAHSNPHIDNCMMCAPRWGQVEVPARFATLDEYREWRAEQQDSTA